MFATSARSEVGIKTIVENGIRSASEKEHVLPGRI